MLPNSLFVGEGGTSSYFKTCFVMGIFNRPITKKCDQTLGTHKIGK
jgi:hypothetical protein